MIVGVAVDCRRGHIRQLRATPSTQCLMVLSVPTVSVHVAHVLIARVAHINVVGIYRVFGNERRHGIDCMSTAVEGELHIVGAVYGNGKDCVVVGIPSAATVSYFVLVAGACSKMDIADRPTKGAGIVGVAHLRLASSTPSVGEDASIGAHNVVVGDDNRLSSLNLERHVGGIEIEFHTPGCNSNLIGTVVTTCQLSALVGTIQSHLSVAVSRADTESAVENVPIASLSVGKDETVGSVSCSGRRVGVDAVIVGVGHLQRRLI